MLSKYDDDSIAQHIMCSQSRNFEVGSDSSDSSSSSSSSNNNNAMLCKENDN